MNSIKDFAMMLLQRNPQISNNPQAKGYLDAINSGDQERMKTVATNICNSLGMTPEQANQQAMAFFGMGKR